MSVWEFIGWLIAVPLALMSLVFVFAVLVAVVRVTVRGAKNATVSNVTPLRRQD
jgi:uncharacterized membrane protein